MKKLSKYLCQLASVVAVLFLIGCANVPTEDLEKLGYELVDPAYVVIKMGEQSTYIENLTFRNVDESKDYEIRVGGREGRALTVALPAGSYYLRRLDMNLENLMSVRNSGPDELLVFAKNKIYYLGDLSWKKNLVHVDFSKEAVLQAMAENPEVFEDRNLHVLNHLFGNAKTAFVRPPSVSGGKSAMISRSRD